MSTPLLNGIVKNSLDNSTYAGALINLYTSKRDFKNISESPVKSVTTDKDGKFEFNLADLELDEAAEVYIQIQHPAGISKDVSDLIDLTSNEDGKVKSVTLYLHYPYKVSNSAGTILFIVLILALAGIAFGYYELHKTPFVEDTATIEFIQFTTSKIDAVDTLSKSDFISNMQGYLKTVSREQYNRKELDSIKYFNVFLALINQADQNIADNNATQYKSNLKQLEYEYTDLERSYLWKDTPGIWFEIFFWALFATILRLAINTGWYISTRRFFSATIVYKLALVFTIPIVAMLISVVLSYFKFTMEVGQSTLSLDLKDPKIAIIVAVLIGLAPWKAWDFMKSLADTLFVKMGGLFGGGKNDSPEES